MEVEVGRALGAEQELATIGQKLINLLDKKHKKTKEKNVGDMKQRQPHCRSSWLQPSLCFSPPQSPCHGIAIKEIYMVLGSGGDFEIYLLKITDKASRRSIV